MPLQLVASEAHCWNVHLDVPPETFAVLHATLSGDERARGERLRFDRDRKRFVVARGALRDVLGRYLGKHPDEIDFTYNAFGKPELSPELGSRLKFNLSHSGDRAVIAVAAYSDVGVDLECVRDGAAPARSALAEIAQYCFTAADVEYLKTVPAHLHAQAFSRCWTKREAYLKARGEGLVDGPVELHGDWSLLTLRPAPGYIGALAVEGNGWRLRHWRWLAGP